MKQLIPKKPVSRDWDAVRRDCLSGTMSFEAIAKKHGMSVTTLRKYRKQWPDAALSADSSDPDHLALVGRLYRATDRQICHLEEKLESGDAAFDEKEARMLGTIARTLDKIMELTTKDTPVTTTAKQTSKAKAKVKSVTERTEETDGQTDGLPDLDTLRQELARRLDRLQQSRPNPVSGDT